MDGGVWQWAWTVLAPIAGWQIKKNADLAKELSEHKTHVAEHYVTKSDFREVAGEIRRSLERIETKLDRKADK